LAAKAATTTIPIVFTTAGDPVALGLVASLNRPGANLTGSAALIDELGPKRLQLLRQLTPNAARFGVLLDPAYPNIQSVITDLQAAVRTMGVQLVVVNARTVAISKRPSRVFLNSAWAPSWSATVPSTIETRNKSCRWRPVMRCPQHSLSVSSPSREA